jgi:hypothetical protein
LCKSLPEPSPQYPGVVLPHFVMEMGGNEVWQVSGVPVGRVDSCSDRHRRAMLRVKGAEWLSLARNKTNQRPSGEVSMGIAGISLFYKCTSRSCDKIHFYTKNRPEIYCAAAGAVCVAFSSSSSRSSIQVSSTVSRTRFA